MDNPLIQCSCVITMFLKVSEINTTSYSLLCWAGHQGTLFLQRRMGKIWNMALQIWLLPQEWGTRVLSWKEQWGLCCLFCVSWVLQYEGRAGNQLWKWNFSCKEPNRSTGILHHFQWQFSVTERLQLGVSRSDGIEILFKRNPWSHWSVTKMLQPLSPVWDCQPCLSPQPVLTHFCLKEIP